MPPSNVRLSDKFDLGVERVYLTGNQALVRLLLARKRLDEEAGLNTAGFVSGYRGSPLGGFDSELWRAAKALDAASIRFQPGVNEDLAATAAWGTQQVGLLPQPKVDGVFALWYGKGPGVDRSGDPFKHGNRQGTSPHGGVLAVFGDDHPGKSSTVSHQSEHMVAANDIPILYPANLREVIEFGLHGFALSRFSGLWVGMKLLNETLETTAIVECPWPPIRPVLPALDALPPGGLHARQAYDPLGDEVRLHRFKLPAALAYARANPLDRVELPGAEGGLGIVTAGKSYADARSALALLGLDDARAAKLGVGLYKVGLVWPLEPTRLREFARGKRELLFVEEKRALMETQAAALLYHLPERERPAISGRRDPGGNDLLPPAVPLDALAIALPLGERLRALGLADDALRARQAELRELAARTEAQTGAATRRLPYFCAGCPHNTSTRVPDGSLAMSGIGCHTMAVWMNRNTTSPTQMGGEGANWIGIAPYTGLPHVFQNMGDGTYAHSGLLAIRAAAAAGVDVTYKILYNDAVAMTGGQPAEGAFSVEQIAHQVVAEGARKVVVVSDRPENFDAKRMPPGTAIEHRDALDRVQRELRATKGATVLIYEQTCAAEKRRRRKRGKMPDPDRRVFVNERVCEGCGDCSAQSNCVAVLPKETPLGRKRAIDPSACNKDESCVKGFCPSFVGVVGGRLRRPPTEALDASFPALPEPPRRELAGTCDIVVTGIGGTGVVTIGAVLAMAAHVEGRGASVFDMTGLAQKNGAVLSHVRLLERAGTVVTPKIGAAECDLLLGCDLVVAAGADALRTVAPGKTEAVVSDHLVPTAEFQLDTDLALERAPFLRALESALGDASRLDTVDAAAVATALLGDSIGANLVLVGYAWQQGRIPLALATLERAIELNGVAVEFNRRALRLGRLAAHDPTAIAAAMPAPEPDPDAGGLDAIVAWRADELVRYQNRALADRYRRLVERTRAAESARAPARAGLAEAVARNYFKLLAYKDEYEVARLYTDGEFRSRLDRQFEGGYSLRFHLAPPLFARIDPDTGRPRKREFGPWLEPVLRALARMKRLRGTPLDVFGYSEERRTERALIGEYDALIERVLADLGDDNHGTAVALARLPESVRGFGGVKAASVLRMRAERERLVARFAASVRPDAAVAA